MSDQITAPPREAEHAPDQTAPGSMPSAPVLPPTETETVVPTAVACRFRLVSSPPGTRQRGSRGPKFAARHEKGRQHAPGAAGPLFVLCERQGVVNAHAARCVSNRARGMA